MEVKVELRPHVAVQSTGIGIAEIDMGQWILLAAIGDNPMRQVGYIGKHEGAHIQPICDLPQSVWEQIRIKAEEAKGAKVAAASSLVSMAQINEVEEDGEE